MAYDDPAYRRRDTGGTGSGGLREDARFGSDNGFGTTPAYQTGSFPVAGEFREPDAMELTQRRAVSQAELDDVFDDPSHGDPGRDRMAVHVVWEVLLLLGAGAIGFLLYREDSDAVRGAALDQLLVLAAGLGLLAIGASLTLRAGAPNLAIGPIAVGAALHFAEQGDRGVLVAAAEAVVAAGLLGLLMAIVVGAFHVPGWAVTLAGALAAMVFIQQRGGPVDLQGDYDPTRQALYLFGGVAAVSVLGGLVGMIKPVRRSVGRFRPVGDPAQRRGGLAAVLTGGALVASSSLAAVGGILLVAGQDAPVVPSPGLDWTAFAIGAAMLGGASAFGRRGGIFGTILAAVLVTLFLRYEDAMGWDISRLAIAGGVVLAGVIVTRIVETYGRPRSRDDALDDDEWTEPDPSSTGWSGSRRTDSWATPLPTQSTAARTDPWDSDRWGTGGR
ncbi:ABC transporter permease [Phytohabitans sp. ZYX-F-186]|uniref:ABC transporter permease n=1 Tax=Phytohabitans maris TaxID=3071409 RepID=A0ABU0ZKN4_9ACTN|nr:ABC transporter permease [Phytohabitans sp. ZYX-F-186]MDQ7906947.1 ABC transporter permease [Phytohabitans sp. ZYX-F-186]